jgi:hypothetical protein
LQRQGSNFIGQRPEENYHQRDAGDSKSVNEKNVYPLEDFIFQCVGANEVEKFNLPHVMRKALR